MSKILPLLKTFISNKNRWRQLLLLVLVIALLILPLEAKAFDWKNAVVGAGAGAALGSVGCIVLSGGWCAIPIIGIGVLGFLTGGAEFLTGLVSFFVNVISFFAAWIIEKLLGLATWGLKVGIDLNTQRIIDPDDSVSQVVLNAAAVTKSVANLILIAILIIIALATIVQIESYGVRKTLPFLIGIALIVNFSTVFVGLIIDSGNTLMRFFWENSNFNNVNLGEYIIRNMQLSETGLARVADINVTSTAGAAAQNLAQAGSKLLILVLGGLAAYIFLRLAILFFMRIGVFWILIMTAPIVFIVGILPIARGQLKEWWKQLINWAFLGPIVFFFLFFGLIIWTQLNLQFQEQDPEKAVRSTVVIVFPIILLFFLYALNISKKMAGAAANAVVDSVISLGKSITLGGAALATGAVLSGVGGAILRTERVNKMIDYLRASKVQGLRRVGGALGSARGEAIKADVGRLGVSEAAWKSFNDKGLISRYEHADRTQKLIIADILMKRQVKTWTPSAITPPATPIIPEEIAKSARGISRGSNAALTDVYDQYIKSQGWDHP